MIVSNETRSYNNHLAKRKSKKVENWSLSRISKFKNSKNLNFTNFSMHIFFLLKDISDVIRMPLYHL